MSQEVYIVECVRTPIGRGYSNGMLSSLVSSDLLALTLNELVARAKIDKAEVEDVVCGCVTPIYEQGGNIGRFAALKAGFPVHVPGIQINRLCGSSQQAIHFASQAIAAGDMDCVIACGVEMMSRLPLQSDRLHANTHGERFQTHIKGYPFRFLHQGESAEMVADKWNISREEMDNFSSLSHERAHNAIQKGYFKKQIVPISIKKEDGSVKVLTQDEGVRYPMDHQKLAQLKPAFRQNGKITAANSSQISDGASAVLLCSAAKVKQLGLTPRARILSRVVLGSDPEMMLTGPIPATKKALEKAKLSIDQIDVIEINEAFASVVIAWMKEFPTYDIKKVNPNGGAIAHGHPVGATGCILMTKLVNELERSGGRYGLEVMCIGMGQATATIIENLSIRAKL